MTPGRAAALVSLLLLACSGGAREPHTAPKPRGWKAYETRAARGVSGFGPARDAEVVSADGKALHLSDVWREHNVALVFYRGHW